MYPFCTALDVVAHELAHGITGILNGGLFYYGQSGGWNGECYAGLMRPGLSLRRLGLSPRRPGLSLGINSSVA